MDRFNNVSRLIEQISGADLIFFQSPTNQLTFASHRRVSSACGIPTYVSEYVQKYKILKIKDFTSIYK